MSDGTPIGLRPRREIEAARAAAIAWLPESEKPDFVKGAVAAYDWLLGLSRETPVSGQFAPVTSARDVVTEEQVADAATYGRAGAPEIPQAFAVGAANAMMWARGLSGVEPPVDLDLGLPMDDTATG